MTQETIFTLDASAVKFGLGAMSEVGEDLEVLGARSIMVLCDPNLLDTTQFAQLQASLDAGSWEWRLFSEIRMEPSLDSFAAAAAFARRGAFDCFLAFGGGSTIDTAKVANLQSTYPADLFDYVNAPIGKGKPVPGPLKPLIGIPTTAGTSSEITGVAIFDHKQINAKTGVAHRFLRPSLGVQDPLNTLDLPPMVTACTGLDVLCHALESFTAIPFDSRDRAESARQRPTYQGSTPVSDIWSKEAISLVAENLVTAIHEPQNLAARRNMMLAAVYGGMGFGNAGVHLCHGMSYPVSSLVRDYHAPDYGTDHAIIPHGMSVVLTAPAVFRFTAKANFAKHMAAAELLGADVAGIPVEAAGEILAQQLLEIMQATGMPEGLEAVGYVPADAETLAASTLPQHRVTKLSPRPASGSELTRLFLESMRNW